MRILSVGRLIECKGFTVLLKACQILREKEIDFRCEIVGGPEEPFYAEYHRNLKALHQELNLQAQVVFRGVQPFTRVLEAFQQTDIFVLSCVIGQDGTQDITPNSLIEAMAMKLPVISTKITAIPEIVDDGVNGILISPNDEFALAETIIKLKKDNQLRKRLGENARKKAEAQFDIRKNVHQYIKVFKQ